MSHEGAGTPLMITRRRRLRLHVTSLAIIVVLVAGRLDLSRAATQLKCQFIQDQRGHSSLSDQARRIYHSVITLLPGRDTTIFVTASHAAWENTAQDARVRSESEKQTESEQLLHLKKHAN